MKTSGQALLGVLAAILSSLLVFGSLVVSLAEGDMLISFLPTVTSTPTHPPVTQKPGEPTFTPSPTSLPSATETMVTPVRPCDFPAGWVQITVNVGDTWESIASRYSITPEQLKSANCMEEFVNGLPPTVVVIWVPYSTPTPTPSSTPVPTATFVRVSNPTQRPVLHCTRPYGWVDYYVRPKDNLYRIGLAFGIDYRELMQLNCLTSIYIRVGQRLYVPNVPVRTAYVSPTPYPVQTTQAPVITSTPIPATPTWIVPSATPVVRPSQTAPVPPATNTSQPMPTASQTPVPTVPVLPTATNTSPPVPTATFTSIPSNTPVPPTNTSAPPSNTPAPTATQQPLPSATNTAAPLPTISNTMSPIDPP